MVVVLIPSMDDKDTARHALADAQMVYEYMGYVVISQLGFSERVRETDAINAVDRMIDASDMVVRVGSRVTSKASEALLKSAKEKGKKVVCYTNYSDVIKRWRKKIKSMHEKDVTTIKKNGGKNGNE